jgi:predicted peroxiredoxin
MFKEDTSRMILPNTARSDNERVYNFYNIATVVEESLNKETVLFFNALPIASNAI